MIDRDDDIRLDDIYTPTTFVEQHPNLLDGDTPAKKRKSLHWMLYRKDANGLAEAGAVIGRHKSQRIVASRFRDWLLSQTYSAE